MTKTIIMPNIHQDTSEVEISRWFVKVGDKIKKGEPLLEVLVEKVAIEIEAEESGKIVEIKQEEGSIVKIGDELAVIEIE